MRRPRLVAAVAVLALVGAVPARAATLPRAFSVEVAAFPVEPAPGLNRTALGVRPAATRASLANPPATSYGRAAQYDLGTIELYTGPPSPETDAECATGSANIPEHAAASPQDMQLEATCSARPGADVRAVGRSYQSTGLQADDVASRVTADGDGEAVTATAHVDVHDIGVGPLVIAGVTTTASASASGTPGGATAAGKVVATGATVNGTPVVIGADGVEVDRQRVPLEQVTAATAAVREALGQGGYSDIRVVQPAVDARPDGTHASVEGGGLTVYFTNNNPAQNYFLKVTFGGVHLAIDVGQSVGGSAPAPAAGPDVLATVPGGGGSASGSPGGSEGVGGSMPAAQVPVARPRPVLTAGHRTYDLPGPWRGWPVLLAVGATAAVAGWLARRQLLGWWNVNADRYLRG
jgi:hypothetical protein